MKWLLLAIGVGRTRCDGCAGLLFSKETNRVALAHTHALSHQLDTKQRSGECTCL